MKLIQDLSQILEDANYAKKLVRGEKAAPGILNKLDHWFSNLMWTKDANRFLPAERSVKQLEKAGFSGEQIHMIRDAAADAAYTAIERMKKKYPDDVPEKYVSAMPHTFQVFDLYLNVGENIRDEFAELMAKLFDAKLDKIQDRLKLKEGYVFEDASELEEGDPVEITGNVEHQGEKGTIERFGSGKKFVVVKFEDGSNASFHSSDVSKADEMYDGEDDMDEDEDPDTFYVAFYDEDEERSWIGMVTKEGGGKWHEKNYKGEADYRWGQSYMSYLTPHDVMSWIHKDYRRGMDIEGPFFDAQEAEDYVNHNWGNLEKRTDEGLNITAMSTASDLLKMVAEQNVTKKNDSAHSSALGKALDKALSKQPKLSAVQVQRNKDRWAARQAAKDEGSKVEEAFKLKDKVKMIGGPKDVRGKEGHIAEIRTDVGGAKKYTIDYEVDGRTTSVMLKASDLRAVKE